MLTDPLNEAREAAHAAFMDAVTLGAKPEDQIDMVFDAVIYALRLHGALNAKAAPETGNLEDTARFLAERSCFPRYTQPGGWEYMLQSESDVQCAYNKATDQLRPGQESLSFNLALARQLLLDRLEKPTEKPTP